MANTQDPKAIWESLTPAQREALLDEHHRGAFADVAALIRAGLLSRGGFGGLGVGLLTDLGRAVGAAGKAGA